MHCTGCCWPRLLGHRIAAAVTSHQLDHCNTHTHTQILFTQPSAITPGNAGLPESQLLKTTRAFCRLDVLSLNNQQCKSTEGTNYPTDLNFSWSTNQWTLKKRIDWLTELRFYVLTDTSNLLAEYWKLNETQQKQACICKKYSTE